MHAAIPDFTEAEQNLVTELLRQRYGKIAPLQLADSELLLDAGREEATLCPTLYWAERGAQFIVCKVASNRYRGLFFYSEAEQYGTGRDEYDDLEECALTLLRVQADHERLSAGASSGATAANFGGAEDDGECHGPVMI